MYSHMYHNSYPAFSCHCMSSSTLVLVLILRIAALVILVTLPCLTDGHQYRNQIHKDMLFISFACYIAFYKKIKLIFIDNRLLQ